MRIGHIVNESSLRQQHDEMIYNLRHRASPETVRKILRIVKALSDEPHPDDAPPPAKPAPTMIQPPSDIQHPGDKDDSTPAIAQSDDDQELDVVREDDHSAIQRQVDEVNAITRELAFGNLEQRKTFQHIRVLQNPEVLKDVVRKALIAKKLPLSLEEDICGWFEKADGTYEERLSFIEDTTVVGYIETSYLLSPEPNNFNSITRYGSVVYDSVKEKFMKEEGKFGATLVGKGELFCIFFGSKVYKGTRGDLVIKGHDVEVKATRSRFMSTTGYGSTSSFYETYRAMLQQLASYKLPPDKNWFNWSHAGLKSLSDLFLTSRDPDKVKKAKHIIDKALEALYLESTPQQRAHVTDVISNDGSFDAESFLRAWVLLQFDYYQSLDGFDGILFINPSNFNFVYVKNSMELDANWDMFRINPSLSWKEVRNVTSQISLL